MFILNKVNKFHEKIILLFPVRTYGSWRITPAMYDLFCETRTLMLPLGHDPNVQKQLFGILKIKLCQVSWNKKWESGKTYSMWPYTYGSWRITPAMCDLFCETRTLMLPLGHDPNVQKQLFGILKIKLCQVSWNKKWESGKTYSKWPQSLLPIWRKHVSCKHHPKHLSDQGYLWLALIL